MQNIKKNTYWKKVFLLDNFFISQLYSNRKKIYKIFKNNIEFDTNTKILDVGTTPTLDYYENFLIHAYPWKNNITCLSDQDCSILKEQMDYLLRI